MPQFNEAKFLDFWEYFNDQSAQHKEAVKRLYIAINAVEPKLLSDEADWVRAYRTRPPAASPPKINVSNNAKAVSLRPKIKIQAQHMAKSCGQTCVAMCIEYLGGKTGVDDYWVDTRYRFNLLGALNANCAGKRWADMGDFTSSMWGAFYASLVKGNPIILFLNGPAFSPSGYGHIVLLTGINGNNVEIADPNKGVWRTVTKQLIETCPAHSEGKAVFMVVE